MTKLTFIFFVFPGRNTIPELESYKRPANVTNPSDTRHWQRTLKMFTNFPFSMIPWR